jgi:hypothetical protein
MCRLRRGNENENGRERKKTLYIEENNNYGKCLGKKQLTKFHSVKTRCYKESFSVPFYELEPF